MHRRRRAAKLISLEVATVPTNELVADVEASRLLVDTITEYAIFFMDPGGTVRTWNLGGERIQGYAADEIIGQDFSRLYPPEAVEQGKPWRELESTRAGGQYQGEDWRVRKDGRRFWAGIVIRPLQGGQNDLLGFAMAICDLTDLKRAQDQLALLTERERIAQELRLNTVRLLRGVELELQGIAGWAKDPEVIEWLQNFIVRVDRGMTDLRRLALDLSRAPGHTLPSTVSQHGT